MNHETKLAEVRRLFEQNLPIFNALGDETRQKLVMLVLDGQERSVVELAELVGLSRPTVSHHLKILKDVGIIAQRHAGTKTIYCSDVSHNLLSIDELVQAVKTLKSCEEE